MGTINFRVILRDEVTLFGNHAIEDKTLQDLRKVGNYNLQKALSLFVHVELTSDVSSFLLCNFA